MKERKTEFYKNVLLPRTAYSTSLTSGLSVFIVNDLCCFPSLFILIAPATRSLNEFNVNRYCSLSMPVTRVLCKI